MIIEASVRCRVQSAERCNGCDGCNAPLQALQGMQRHKRHAKHSYPLMISLRVAALHPLQGTRVCPCEGHVLGAGAAIIAAVACADGVTIASDSWVALR
jgi:hypothetical protein